MLRTRVIPCLLLRDLGLVKTVKFRDPKYVGDPINAVRIFNDKEVDELVFLDITATVDRRQPQFGLIEDIATECFMPFGYGGGIHDIETASRILKLGSEKVVLNTAAVNLDLIEEAAQVFGSQSVVVSIDAKQNRRGKYQVFTHSGSFNTKKEPRQHARDVEAAGAGEIVLTSIDRDGTMEGYAIDLLESVTNAVNIPVVACGGAGTLEHFREAVIRAKASAVAAGSMFVFHGPHRAVLISYPTQEELKRYLD
ncbi:MAG: AglZ/HisF2 family acetamidino modification protein [Candidatus Thorarchaeota archaeon SMTZ1-83]|nr:MAG: imidazole glycerol phosphate synthase cyclase subunit [Candidatus Thorarchaeota archaeon SMTZ1-83]